MNAQKGLWLISSFTCFRVPRKHSRFHVNTDRSQTSRTYRSTGEIRLADCTARYSNITRWMWHAHTGVSADTEGWEEYQAAVQETDEPFQTSL